MATTEVDGRYICPYNKSHLVSKKRLPYHLVRCRNNNPALAEKIVKCPFNYSHHVPKEELEEHLRSCNESFTFQYLSYERQSLRPREKVDIPLNPEREHLADNNFNTHRNIRDKTESSMESPNPRVKVDEVTEGTENLRYLAHRKYFEKPLYSNDTPRGREQNRRNHDDLDEWFA